MNAQEIIERFRPMCQSFEFYDGFHLDEEETTKNAIRCAIAAVELQKEVLEWADVNASARTIKIIEKERELESTLTELKAMLK